MKKTTRFEIEVKKGDGYDRGAEDYLGDEDRYLLGRIYLVTESKKAWGLLKSTTRKVIFEVNHIEPISHEITKAYLERIVEDLERKGLCFWVLIDDGPFSWITKRRSQTTSLIDMFYFSYKGSMIQRVDVKVEGGRKILWRTPEEKIKIVKEKCWLTSKRFHYGLSNFRFYDDGIPEEEFKKSL